jgi:hypothetical protein
MTTYLANIDTQISFNQGGGNFQAIGALILDANSSHSVSQLAAYIVQDGGITGSFQMAILQPTSTSNAVVVAVTNIATSITPGLFILPLTSPYTMAQNALYYLAVYNQVNASQIGGVSAGLGTTQDAPPINFRAQNLLTGFSVGANINTSDVSLRLTPWLAALQ